MSAYNFIDEINRLFDELVVEPWKPQRRELAGPRPAGDESELVVSVPADEAVAQAVSVGVEAGQIVVTVRRNHERRQVVGGAEVASGAAEHFRRAFPIPPGTVLQGVETRFEDGTLNIRIRLSRRG